MFFNQMSEQTYQIGVKYDVSKRIITIKGSLDAFGTDTPIKMSVAELSQIYYLFQQGTLQDIIKKKTESSVVKVLGHEVATQNFLGLGKALLKCEEKRVRETVTPKLKKELWEKYHECETVGECYTCGVKIDSFEWHAAHVIAFNKGGSIEIENLRTCCSKCNLRMQDQCLYEYIVEKDLTGPGRDMVEDYFKKNKCTVEIQVKNERWISIEEYEKRYLVSPICSYVPPRGCNTGKVCGNPAINQGNPLLLRCTEDATKQGTINKSFTLTAQNTLIPVSSARPNTS